MSWFRDNIIVNPILNPAGAIINAVKLKKAREQAEADELAQVQALAQVQVKEQEQVQVQENKTGYAPTPQGGSNTGLIVGGLIAVSVLAVGGIFLFKGK